MKRFFIIIAGIVAMMTLVGACLIGYVTYEVFGGNYDHLQRERILEILSRETVVYYADGQSQLGSLFGTEHRQYVPLREMPRYLLDAVVASEDENFYHHIGIDFVGTMRAAFHDIVYGRREGASTITQQTVKNLYGRPVTNLRAKFVEAINAFKLERKYKKDEILEFYLNQFHVTGNGRGVGIAAKYYFDKDVQDLSLTEAAFIAGSVKWPVRYNPFTKRTREAQDKARSEAKNRKNYVLRRMLENKFISKEQYEVAKDEEVPFHQGRFQFNEIFITELVRRQIARPEVLAAVGADNVDALATMGLRVTTTIEKPVQIAAQYGVRQNLSRLEMILQGFKKESEKTFSPVQRPEKYGFYTAKIKAVDRTSKKESVTLSLGVPDCTVPTDGIDRVAHITDQALYRGFLRSKKELMTQLNEGDYVLASIREIAADGHLTCDLERKPRIQGALIALDKGKVAAMVGGYSPHEFNRAVFAKRQPGSTFKTLTYYAALQLGWDVLDSLMNVRNVYNWQGQFYYPRPDHAPQTSETTFAGAGAMSENLASIWLLAHLLDKLTLDQFKDLLVSLDVMPGGSADALERKAASTFNVRPTEHNLKSGIFSFIRSDLLNDVTIARNEVLKTVLRQMNYGFGFEDEMKRVEATKDLPPKERLARIHMLRNTLLRWQRVRDEANQALDFLKKGADSGDWTDPQVRAALGAFRLTLDGRHLAYISNDAYEPNPMFNKKPMYSNVVAPQFKDVSVEDISAALELDRDLLNDSNVLLDGVLPLSLVKEIDDSVNDKYAAVQNAPLIEKLYWHDDFRYSVGMLYAAKMVSEMGVDSEIQWVPSFPLGANVVTLSELALAYQTIATGRTYRYFNGNQDNQVLLIQRIEDSQGQLLWEAEPQHHQLVDEFYSIPMLSVLRGTVTNGTGRTANNTVVLRHTDPDIDKQLESAFIRVPNFGKTGTTNDYVNATYVGFLPYPAAEGASELSRDNMYTIASYVGYDTNEPMVRRGFKVAGGSGALPAWIETALALIREEKFADKLNWKTLAEKKVHEVPFDYEGSTRITVPLYGNTLVSAEIENDDTAKLDVNTFIDDYGKTGNGQTVKLALPGKISDSIFIADKRVALFKPAKDSGKAAAPLAAKPLENEDSAKESIPGIPTDQNASKKDPEELKPQMPEDNLRDLNMDNDLDLQIPPPPEELKQ